MKVIGHKQEDKRGHEPCKQLGIGGQGHGALVPVNKKPGADIGRWTA